MVTGSPVSIARIEGDASALTSGVIIPRKGLGELKRLVDEVDAEEIELAFGSQSGLARKGDVSLVMRLIEGEFPNYGQVIPKDPVAIWCCRRKLWCSPSGAWRCSLQNGVGP